METIYSQIYDDFYADSTDIKCEQIDSQHEQSKKVTGKYTHCLEMFDYNKLQ